MAENTAVCKIEPVEAYKCSACGYLSIGNKAKAERHVSMPLVQFPTGLILRDGSFRDTYTIISGKGEIKENHSFDQPIIYFINGALGVISQFENSMVLLGCIKNKGKILVEPEEIKGIEQKILLPMAEKKPDIQELLGNLTIKLPPEIEKLIRQ